MILTIHMRLMIQVDADISQMLKQLKYQRVQLILPLEMKKNLNGLSLKMDQYQFAIKLFLISEITRLESIHHLYARMDNKMLIMPLLLLVLVLIQMELNIGLLKIHGALDGEMKVTSRWPED